LRDEKSTVTVTDENHWPILHCQHPVDGSKVIAEGRQRVLCDGDVVAISCENIVDGLPSRSGDKGAVYQDDIANRRRLRWGGRTERQG
jgi:hypothetical protein